MWNIRAAVPGEVEELSDLAVRSKGYWGYSEEFLEACREELAVTAAHCAAGRCWVADMDGTLLGFARLSGERSRRDASSADEPQPLEPSGELEALFVDPEAIGSGVGAALLRYALAVAVSAGMDTVLLDADPGAEGFYLHHGARRVGETPSGSVAGRLLPRLEFDLRGLRGGQDPRRQGV